MQLGVFNLGKYTGLEALAKRRVKFTKMRDAMLEIFEDIDEERDSNPLMQEQEEVIFTLFIYR